MGDLPRDQVAEAVATVENAAQRRFRTSFANLPAADQDATIASIESLGDAADRDAAHILIELTLYSYYANPENGGNRNEVSWKMIGYTRRAGRPLTRADVAAAASTRAAYAGRPAKKCYDAIVIGAGAGGGVVACCLAEAGLSVLLLERGRSLSLGDVSSDHLRNQRFSRYGHNAGPDDDHPRVAVAPDGTERIVLPHEGGYQNNAAIVGGGTRVYGAMSWRYMHEDFRMATTYGAPEGSSLADWPISYDDLEPYYERAEWELGVCGDGDANAHQAPRKRGYPMPPMPPNAEQMILRRGADTLGINTFPPPLMINSVPYGGRNACARRGDARERVHQAPGPPPRKRMATRDTAMGRRGKEMDAVRVLAHRAHYRSRPGDTESGRSSSSSRGRWSGWRRVAQSAHGRIRIAFG